MRATSGTTRRCPPRSCTGHKAGLAGATALRGIEGFGANSVIHRPRLFRFSQDMPLLIVIVDEEDRIRAFLPQFGALVADSMILLEEIEVLHYKGNEHP